MNFSADVIIVGAGIAGLAACQELTQGGVSTIILEKSRGQGGRCATRRGQDFIADHGAQFFRTKNPDWERFISLQESDLHPVFPSPQSVHPRYTLPSGMSSLARFFRVQESLKTLQKVVHIAVSTHQKFCLVKTENGEQFISKRIILTAPIPQSLELLAASQFPFEQSESVDQLRAIRYHACIALIAELDETVTLGTDGILKNPSSDFAGIYHQNEKGLKTAQPVLVAHASPDLSAQLWLHDSAILKEILIARIEACLAQKNVFPKVKQVHIHRWKYSEPKACFPADHTILASSDHRIALAGDGFASSFATPSIEGAFVSGRAAARALMQQGI